MPKNIKKFDALYEQICNEGGWLDLARGRFNQIKTGSAVPWGPTGNTEPFLEMFRTFVSNVRALIKKYKQESDRIVHKNPANVNSPALTARQRIQKLDHFLANLSSDPTGNKGRLICGPNNKEKRGAKEQIGPEQKGTANPNNQTDKKYLTTSNDIESQQWI